MNSANRRRIEIINADIELIDKVLQSNDENELKRVHRELDGRYQSCIKDWGKGMYAHHPTFGFVYDNLGVDSLKDNISLMRPKLESFKEGWNELSASDSQNNINVTVNNEISLEISFNQARSQMDNMAGLTDSETEDIKARIDELEEISKESLGKKKKWERIKPIIAFAMDKGVDVAIVFMSLILQMKLLE